MSQSVQLDMEVLQRIKFLMEYDVMKTSSENILFEQSTDLQKLAKEKGFGPVSLSKAQELYNQGKLGNTFDPISGQAKVLASRDPAVIKANQQKYGTIDVPRTDVSRMYSQIPQDLKDQNLEELTIKVRNIMTDWRTMTIETSLSIIGVGIPAFITANGFWFTLELAQVLKGNPNYLNLLFSLIGTVTAGALSTTLRPLYQAVGKSLKGGGKDFVYVLELLYFHAKELGLWNKLEPILRGIKTGSKAVTETVSNVLTWLFNTAVGKGLAGIGKGLGFMGKGLGSLLSTGARGVSWLLNLLDTGLAYIATKAGINPQVAQKLGSAARWGSVPYVIHTNTKPPKSDEEELIDVLEKPVIYPSGTFTIPKKQN